MPIALTNWKIINERFTASDVDNFISQLDAYLISVHWVSTAVANGYKYLVTSPQGLQCYVYVRNLGHVAFLFGPFTCTFNMQSLDGTITGQDQEIAVTNITDRTFVIIAGKCQFALAVVGRNSGIEGTSLICGIPFIPDEDLCHGVKPSNPTNQCFYSMGDFNATGSPRKYLILGSSPFGDEPQTNYEAVWDNLLIPGGSSLTALRMPVLTYASYAFNAFDFPSEDVWATHDFWRMEPMLAWAAFGGDPILTSQLWDSMVFAKKFPMDYTIQMDGVNWYVYTDNYLYGVLAFLFTPTGEGGNPFPGSGSDDKLAAFLY